MTSTITISTLLCLWGLPIDASLLDGERLSGELQSVSSTEAVLVVDGENRTIPLSEFQEFRWTDSNTPLPSSRPALQTHDGSLLTAESLTAAKQEFTLTNSRLGELIIPKASVSNLRLGPLDSTVAAAWEAFLSRESQDDLIVIRKGDALDHVAGVVSTISDDSIGLLLDGRAIDLPRSRVFGIIYASSEVPASSPLCVVEFTDSQRLAAVDMAFADDKLSLTTSEGQVFSLATDAIKRIDFSLGKIMYLSQTEPASVKYPTDHPLYLEAVWKYRRGQNSRGASLQLGGRQYDNGIWVHSGTVLRYRLGRQYRRFQSLMGIDEDLGDCAPQLGLVIRGDGRVLYEQDVKRTDEVRELDLDVSDVRELEIEVTSTDPNGICEHLDLVEARLIK
ncbi:MAG: NPCBM/NEW2 domain-containing protein [Planctomycetaceae bacterium]|nr:NPCBM/NEW2 domain-containing protein [Planctomycetaceae bacterium]